MHIYVIFCSTAMAGYMGVHAQSTPLILGFESQGHILLANVDYVDAVKIGASMLQS